MTRLSLQAADHVRCADDSSGFFPLRKKPVFVTIATMRFTPANWICFDQALINQLSDQFGLSDITVRALFRRGLMTSEQINAFLHPETQPLPSCYEMDGVDRAASIIREAIDKRVRICIYGDYDADGVCASAILYRCLKKLGANVLCYIPSRHSEGYGLNEDAVRKLAKSGVEMLITVDNGISAVQETDLAHSLGMTVVVTDHHRSGDTLPNADALVSVSQGDFRQRVGDICGAGVAWLIACALENGKGEEYLPFVAVATIADIVSLTGCNRILVTRGIPLVRMQVGFNALLETASAGDAEVTESTLGFLIGPRLNAAGRMGNANTAFELLIEDDPNKALSLALTLQENNNARRNEELRILTECLSMAPDGGEENILMLAGEDWNVGVVGIVAARLVEMFYKPVILLTEVEPGIYTGSARSIPEIDMFSLLSAAKNHFIRYGGHSGAAGLTLRKEEIESVRTLLLCEYLNQRQERIIEKCIKYEEVLPLEVCDVKLYEELHLFAPFGQGNPEPQFLVRGELKRVSYLGQGKKHLAGSLCNKGKTMRIVGFSQGRDYHNWINAFQAEAVCTLRRNDYRGKTDCELICLGLSAWKSLQSLPEYNIITNAFLQAITDEDEPSLKRCAKDLLAFFPFRMTEEKLRPLYLNLIRKAQLKQAPESEEEQAAALIFKELGFFEPDKGLTPRANAMRRSCMESELFKGLASYR